MPDNYKVEGDEDKTLAYDLRQYNAKVTGEIVLKHSVLRDEKNFPLILESLRNLYDEIDYKLTDEQIKEWKTLYDSLLEIIDKNESAYVGTSNDAEERNDIDLKLRECYRWLKRMMEEHSIFGARWDDEGL